jgi:hypothetical protein
MTQGALLSLFVEKAWPLWGKEMTEAEIEQQIKDAKQHQKRRPYHQERDGQKDHPTEVQTFT